MPKDPLKGRTIPRNFTQLKDFFRDSLALGAADQAARELKREKRQQKGEVGLFGRKKVLTPEQREKRDKRRRVRLTIWVLLMFVIIGFVSSQLYKTYGVLNLTDSDADILQQSILNSFEDRLRGFFE